MDYSSPVSILRPNNVDIIHITESVNGLLFQVSESVLPKFHYFIDSKVMSYDRIFEEKKKCMLLLVSHVEACVAARIYADDQKFSICLLESILDHLMDI